MAIYYIKPAANGGSDSNNGLSSSTAWATLGKALSASPGLSAGDIVYIAPGTYRESLSAHLEYLGNSGTDNNPITIKGDPRALQPWGNISPGIVRWTVFPTDNTNPTTGWRILSANSKNYVKWESIYFDTWTSSYAITLNLCRGWSFTKCCFNSVQLNNQIIQLTNAAGIPYDFTLDQCVLYGMQCLVATHERHTSTYDVNINIKDCLFLGNPSTGQAIVFTPSGTGSDGNGVKIYNSYFAGFNSQSIYISSTNTTHNSIVKNCIIINGNIFGSVTGAVVQTYNRLLGSSLQNTASSTTTISAGTSGLSLGYERINNLFAHDIYSSYLNSPLINTGELLNSPTTDLYGNPWTGANPDVGPIAYRPLSNPQYIASDSVVNIRQNTTSRTEFINLNSVGYKFNTATLIASYVKLGGTRTSIPLVNQTVTGAWVSGGFVEIDPVNMPGLYRFDIPDTVFSSSASAIQIINTANSDKTTITYKFTQEYKIDLTQAIPQINVPNTVGDALNAARAGTFGGMTIGNKELNYYSPTNAIIKTFTVDSNTYIRSKKEKNFIPYDGLKLYLDAGKGLSYSGSGSNWVDLSGNYNNGTLINGPTFNSANEGTIAFDGTNDYISFNTQPLSSTAFTIILNFKVSSFTTDNGAYRRLIAINGTGYTGNTFSLFVSNTGQIGYLLGNGSGNLEDYTNTVGVPVLELNKWYHVCLTFNGTQKKLYIGGNLIVTNTSSTTFTNPLNNKLILGSYNGSIGCLQGSIGAVHIYDRALSDSEVLSNYAIYSNRYISGVVTSGLMLYIDPNNLQSYPGSGTLLYNLVGTSYNGIMSNGASFGTDSTGGYIATDGTNDFVKFPITRSTVPYTVFVFARVLGNGRLISDDSNWLMGNYQGSQNVYHANSWVLQSGGGPTGNGWRSHCVTGDYASDNWKVYANGVKLAENNQGTNGFTNITWGAWNSGSEPCAGHFSVFLIYDRVLTDAEVLQNHEALRGRYGI
jgi:hypothetical protein